MKSETIVYCVVALLLGMLLANMLKNVCGCKTVEGNDPVVYGSTASRRRMGRIGSILDAPGNWFGHTTLGQLIS